MYTVLASAPSLTIGCISHCLFLCASCSLICWLPCVMSFSLHSRGTLSSLFRCFLPVSPFLFCVLSLSFCDPKVLLYLSLPPLSFPHFIFSPFPTAAVKSEPHTASFSSRPVQLLRSSLLSSLLAITLHSSSLHLFFFFIIFLFTSLFFVILLYLYRVPSQVIC